MTTGMHNVCNLYCRQCQTIVGWGYEKALIPSEKYKEGMCILERELIIEEGTALESVDINEDISTLRSSVGLVLCSVRELSLKK